MSDITKPAVERHSCDIAGCASMAENPMYWGVSFPIVARDNYDDGSYFGGTRTRIINRSIDLCDYHAASCSPCTASTRATTGTRGRMMGPNCKPMTPAANRRKNDRS